MLYHHELGSRTVALVQRDTLYFDLEDILLLDEYVDNKNQLHYY